MYSRSWLSWSVKAWCVSLINDLRKFLSRSWQDRFFFIEAYVLLGVLRMAILTLPFRTITEMMGLEQGQQTVLPEKTVCSDAGKIGWAVQAAASRTPWESACLVQALTGMVMLGRRNIHATLYLGIAKVEGLETMAAHAWLSCGGVILTGAGGVERYTAISMFSRSLTKDVLRKPKEFRAGM